MLDVLPPTVDWTFAEGDTIRMAFSFFTDEACTVPMDITGTIAARIANCNGYAADGTIDHVGSSSIVVRFHDGASPDLKFGSYGYSVTLTDSNGERQTLVMGVINVATLEMGCNCAR